MKNSYVILLIIIIVLLLVYLFLYFEPGKLKQMFSDSGALIQLQTSRPYYFMQPFNQSTRDFVYYNPYLYNYQWLYPYYPINYSYVDMDKVKGYEEPIKV